MSLTYTTRVQVTRAGYRARLHDDGRVEIYRHEGPESYPWAGTGRWDDRAGQIVDCPADLGDEAYGALDAAIADALDEESDRQASGLDFGDGNAS